MVWQPLPPSPLPQTPLVPRDAPATAPAPTAGVFAGIHSRLVDSLTRGQVLLFLDVCLCRCTHTHQKI